jgi:hypothetical protein
LYYTVYKITNKINGKFYIGKHQTKNLDDDYMGSGKLIKAAIEKYGKENFFKEILHIFDKEEDMNAKESELVILSENSYNLCPGGHGSFGHLNDRGDKHKNRTRKAALKTAIVLNEKYGVDNPAKLPHVRQALSIHSKERWLKGLNKSPPNWKGKKHSLETRKRMSETKLINGSQKGIKNSQYGTIWITNNIINKKQNSQLEIPEGWRKGRI